MKRNNYKKIFISVSVFVSLLFAGYIYAASDYTYLEGTAFKGFNTASTGNKLADFLVNVFNFGIAAAVVLALIMIIWGGIIYTTTDSWNGKEDGKSKIQDALYGLGLVLVSYLILYTINPCLVQWIPKTGDACKTTNTFLK